MNSKKDQLEKDKAQAAELIKQMTTKQMADFKGWLFPPYLDMKPEDFKPEDVGCNECGNAAKIIMDKQVGLVTDCHGVGFSWDNGKGEIVEVNQDLRYISEWNE